MRHRMGCASSTGLGNSSPALLKNQWSTKKEFNKKVKSMLEEAIKTFPLMKKCSGCDLQIYRNVVEFGIEPAYQYDHLELVSLNQNKEFSFIENGYAHGVYGSDIATTRRYYKSYKYESKFIKFINRWHKIIWTKKTD